MRRYCYRGDPQRNRFAHRRSKGRAWLLCTETPRILAQGAALSGEVGEPIRPAGAILPREYTAPRRFCLLKHRCGAPLGPRGVRCPIISTYRTPLQRGRRRGFSPVADPEGMGVAWVYGSHYMQGLRHGDFHGGGRMSEVRATDAPTGVTAPHPWDGCDRGLGHHWLRCRSGLQAQRRAGVSRYRAPS